MPTTFSRRTFTAGGLATIAAGTIIPTSRIIAQEGVFSGLDLPALDVTVTTSGFGGVPPEIEAGRYLLTVTPEADVEWWGAAFVQPPEGLTAEQLLLDLESATEVVPQDAETPATRSVSRFPPAGAPLVAYEAMFAGGAMGLPGSSEPVQAVIDLPPGEWVLWGGASDAVQSPLVFQATGEMPGDLAEPEADIDVTFSDSALGIDGSLASGEHLLRIVHEGNEPHRLEIMKGPDGMTEEDIDLILPSLGAVAMEETPAALPFDPETELTHALITADQSMGTVQWVPVSLEAGTYVAMCLFPAREDAALHAMEGEYTVFTVE